MSQSGREALPEVREWSGDPQGCPGVVRRPYRMSARPSRIFGSGRKTLPDVREWSGDHPGCPGVVGRPSRMSGSGWEALLGIREWS